MTTSVAVQSLSRAIGDVRAAAPVRIVHLGLGNFFRAHQASYTDRAPDAAEWGIAAFSGRSSALADALDGQGGLYTLITRGRQRDTAEIVASVSRTHPGPDIDSWLGYFADPRVAIVTLTVTEAGYVRNRSGRADLENASLRADLEALRGDLRAPVSTVPAKLVAGLAARRHAGVGAIAIVACDNLPENGAVTAIVVGDVAAALDPGLAEWIRANVSFVTTMVDRITPATTPDDPRTALSLTGFADTAPVVTEPYSEWVLSGAFPAGRPAWDAVGARIVDDIAPFEERKLWLLNGAHSLLAYAGSARGHTTIAQAVGDPQCRAWVQEWWAEAAAQLTLPRTEIDAYCEALLDRFDNPGIRHLLAQIAADGSQKLPVRILPAIRRHRRNGHVPTAGLRVLAAWLLHLRGAGAPVKDVDGERFRALAQGPLTTAAQAVLTALDATLAEDPIVVDGVVELCQALSGQPAH